MQNNKSDFKITFFYAAFESIAIEYLSAVLKKKGYKTSLVFSPHLNTASTGLKKYILTSEDDFAKQIADTKPNLIAFSVTTNTYKRYLLMSRLVKKILPDTPIIFGGIHPSSVPETVITEKSIDYICIGEGEEAIVELATAIKTKSSTENIPNIWSKQNDKIIKNPVRPMLDNLDSIPFPDKNLFKGKVSDAIGNAYIIFTGRGCPFNCSYCYNCVIKKIYGSKYKLRRRSVNNVIQELKEVVSTKKPKSILFMDDTLIYDKQWFTELAQKYVKHINLPYSCHLHPQFIDEEMVDILENSGCSSAVIAVQTISEDIRKNILDRNEKNEELAYSINLLRKSKIYTYTNIMYNLPTQTNKELIDTACFLNKNPFNFAIIFSLRYNPALNIIDKAKNLKILKEHQLQEIEKADEHYEPLKIHDTSVNQNIITLLFTAGNIPEKIFNFIILHRLYNYRTKFISLILFTFFLLDTFKTAITRKKRGFMCLDLISHCKSLLSLTKYCLKNIFINLKKELLHKK